VPKLPRDLWIIYGSLLFFAFGLGLYTVIMPAYIRDLGATAVQLGFLGSLAMAVSTMAAIPGGMWADRFERRKLMIIGWAIAIPVPLIFALADHWLWIIPGFVLFNLSMFSNAAMQSYIAAKCPPEARSFTFTLVHTAFPVGMVFAPTMGGFLAEQMGMRAVFWASLACYAISTLILTRLSPSYPLETSTKMRVALDPRSYPRGFWNLLFTCSLTWFVITIPTTFNTPFLQDVARFDLLTIGFLGSIAALGGAMLSPFIGRAADKAGSWRILASCLVILALTFIVQLYTTEVNILAAAFFIRGGTNVVMSLMTALVTGAADPKSMGMSFALYNMVAGLASTLSPYAAGWLYAEHPTFPFIATVFLAMALAIYFWSKPQPRRKGTYDVAGQ